MQIIVVLKYESFDYFYFKSSLWHTPIYVLKKIVLTAAQLWKNTSAQIAGRRTLNQKKA